jgi:hypothetical protein
MMRDLYAYNYPQRRLETLLRAEGRCENMVDGQRCSNRLGTFKISHSHHPNDDPENPDAEMIAVCASCHMRLHRQPGSNGKASSKKQGYKVVRLDQLLHSLAATGFSASFNEECRVSWRFDPCGFQADAADMLDALAMCLHWLGGEVRDLQEALVQAQAKQRRLRDAALREIACCTEGDGRL